MYAIRSYYDNRVELYSGYYSKAMPEETIRTIAVNDVVEQNILLSLAKKLKIKVVITSYSIHYTKLYELVKPRFQRIEGVGAVDIFGGLEREILVELNPEKLDNYDLGVSDVVSVLESYNFV